MAKTECNHLAASRTGGMSCLILFVRCIFSEGVLPLVLVYFFCISRGIRSEGVFVIKTRKVLLDFRIILAHKVCPGGSNTKSNQSSVRIEHVTRRRYQRSDKFVSVKADPFGTLRQHNLQPSMSCRLIIDRAQDIWQVSRISFSSQVIIKTFRNRLWSVIFENHNTTDEQGS